MAGRVLPGALAGRREAGGHTGHWLQALEWLAGELDGVPLHPGHGPPGSRTLFADQRRYLLMYREAVRRLAGGAPALTDPQKQELTELMTGFLPGAAVSWLVGLGADAVAAELAAAAVPYLTQAVEATVAFLSRHL